MALLEEEAGPSVTLSVPPLVPGSSYQVSHEISQHGFVDEITDVCRFERPDGTYVVFHNKGEDEHIARDLARGYSVPIPRSIAIPGKTGPSGHFDLVGGSAFSNRNYMLTAESKATLGAIGSYCLQTEVPADQSHTTVTIPLDRRGL